MNEFVKAGIESLIMVFSSSFFSILLGLPLAILLVLIKPQGLHDNPRLFRLLDGIINLLRSLPFIILMVILLPLAKLLIGRSTGTYAMIIPLSIAAAPFAARILEQNLNEVDHGIIEAAISMGANSKQIVTRVLIPEALPSLVSGITLTIINIIGYSAMAGSIGGGGLGDLAIRTGYYRNVPQTLIISVALIIALVQAVQWCGSHLSRRLNKK